MAAAIRRRRRRLKAKRRARSAARSASACAKRLSTLDLSKQLATIRCDVRAAAARSTMLALKPQDAERLGALFERLEFTRLLRRVRAGGESATGERIAARPRPQPRPKRRRSPVRSGSYETVVTMAALEAWLDAIAAAPLVALDTETTSLAYMRAELVGISLAVAPGEGRVHSARASLSGSAGSARTRDAVLAAAAGRGSRASAPKVGQHLKCDAHIFANHGIDAARRRARHDARVVRARTRRRRAHDLDSVAALYLGLETLKYEEVGRQGREADHVRPSRPRHGHALLRRGCRPRAALHEVLWPKLGRGCPSSRASTARSSGPLRARAGTDGVRAA